MMWSGVPLRGYLEGLNDWYDNNKEAVEWFLENSNEIRKAVRLYNNQK